MFIQIGHLQNGGSVAADEENARPLSILIIIVLQNGGEWWMQGKRRVTKRVLSEKSDEGQTLCRNIKQPTNDNEWRQ